MVFMPHWPIKYNRHPKRHDLAPMTKLLEKLGNPHKKIPNIIHVAGTNGKGSSCAFLESILKEHNYKVHKYTSPHLLEFNERIVIAGEEISDEYLFQTIEKIRRITEECQLENSLFEITSAATFLVFAENKADFTILETGLGGRLDATNVIENPIATIITTISYEHTEYLGPTLPIIAGEKAGIIKEGAPCIIAPQTEEVFERLFDVCERKKAESIAYGYDFTISKSADGFLFESKKLTHDFPSPSLLGDHQMLNAASSIAALSKLPISLNPDRISKALQNTFWPARLQKASYKNLEIYIDGGHNEAGANALSIWLKENIKKPIPIILGMTNNRNVKAFAEYFKDTTQCFYCVKVMSEACSYESEKLASLVSENNIKSLPCDNLEEALIEAGKISDKILIAGSLFLASDMLKLLR